LKGCYFVIDGRGVHFRLRVFFLEKVYYLPSVQTL